MIVTDLDGTLLNKNEKVSEESKKYLKRLKDMGYIIVIATGRIYASALKATDGAEFANFLITDAGACLYDLSNSKTIFKNGIDKKTVKKLLSYYNNNFRYITICCKNNMYKYSDEIENSNIIKTIKDEEFILNNAEDVFHIPIAMKNNEGVINVFGYYQESTKELLIYSKYLSKIYIPVLNENNVVDEKVINDSLNLNMLTNISHELGHVVRGKEFEEFKKRKASFLDIKSDYALYYWFKNGTLRLFVGNDRYCQLHDEFIEEVRADIFSILDINQVINKHFKDAFPKDLLERNCLWNAYRIVNFYTEKNENGISISTPMKKFDKMFATICPNEENKSLSRELEEDASTDEIINNLLLGDNVPYYLLKHLFKINSGQIITTNIYDELLNIISQKQSETVDENKPKNK